MIIEVIKEVGFVGNFGASMSLDGRIADNNGDSLASLDQASVAKITFYENMTFCLNKTTEEMNNQTKQQADAIMMQYMDHQTQILMGKKHFGANLLQSSILKIIANVIECEYSLIVEIIKLSDYLISFNCCLFLPFLFIFVCLVACKLQYDCLMQ